MDITQMDINQLRLLLYLLLGLLAALVVGLAYYLSRTSRRGQPARTELSAGQFDLDLSQTVSADKPALQLVRDPTTGRFAVELQGQRYQRLSEIEEPGLRRQVMLAAAEMVDFTGVLGEGEPRLLPAEEAIYWREDLRRAAAASETASFLEKVAREADQPEIAPVTLMGALQRRLRGEGVEPTEILSLAEEIDAIVQRRLGLTRGLEGRTLHLRQGEGDRIVFEFDGAEYSSAEDIPNHTARLLVQDAIREWEETR
jgi:hypothetical protein